MNQDDHEIVSIDPTTKRVTVRCSGCDRFINLSSPQLKQLAEESVERWEENYRRAAERWVTKERLLQKTNLKLREAKKELADLKSGKLHRELDALEKKKKELLKSARPLIRALRDFVL